MIQMKSIYKSFGSNHVLKDVDLTLNNGEVLALVGENGAGKSTLMNILGGVLPSDKGQIFIDGQEVRFSVPKDTKNVGGFTLFGEGFGDYNQSIKMQTFYEMHKS